MTAIGVEREAAETDWPGYGAFAGAALIWGSTFLAIAFSNEVVAPLWGATLRLAIASVFLVAIALATRAAIPRGGALRDLVLYGVLGFGGNLALLYWGEQKVPSGITAVVFATAPLQTALYARAFGVERLDRVKVIGAVMALAGVATIFAGQLGVGVPAPQLVGVFGAAVSASIGAVILRRAGRQSVWTINAIGAPVGAAVCLVASLLLGEARVLPAVTAAAWWPILYLAIFGSLGAYVLFTFLVGHWGPTKASFVGVVVPVIALFLGALVRSEIPPAVSFVGTALVIGSVLFVLTRSHGGGH